MILALPPLAAISRATRKRSNIVVDRILMARKIYCIHWNIIIEDLSSPELVYIEHRLFPGPPDDYESHCKNILWEGCSRFELNITSLSLPYPKKQFEPHGDILFRPKKLLFCKYLENDRTIALFKWHVNCDLQDIVPDFNPTWFGFIANLLL